LEYLIIVNISVKIWRIISDGYNRMKINTKRAFFAAALLALAFGAFFALRSTYVSNYMKRLVFAEIEHETEYQVTAVRLYLNLFPFYVGAKEVMVLDEKGEKVLTSEGVKAYIALPAPFRKTLHIRRIALKRPVAWLDPARIGHIKKLAARKQRKEGLRVKVGAVAVTGGAAYFSDPEKGLNFQGEGMGGEAVFGDAIDLNLSTGKTVLSAKGIPEMSGSLDSASAEIKGDNVRLKRLSMTVEGSKVGLEGAYSKDKGFALKTDFNLLVDSIKKIMGLRSPGEGKLSVKGDVKVGDFSRWMDAYIDLKVKGSFRIETLLEAVRAREDISGMASVEGRVEGTLRDFTGRGKGTLKGAGIYGLSAERLDFGISWASGVLSFKGVKGSIYGGKASADVSLDLPEVNNFAIRVDVSGVRTSQFLKFIELDLPIPEGKLDGDLYSSGSVFAPYGRFSHETTSPGADFPGRIRTVEGDYLFVKEGVAIRNLAAKTALSEARGGGMFFMEEERLDFAVHLKTEDIGDLTRPYFTEASGKGEISGRVWGPVSYISLEGKAALSGASIEGHRFGSVSTEFLYRKNLLAIKSLSALIEGEEVTAGGSIHFPGARGLFEFGEPVYDIEASLRQTPLQSLKRLLEIDLPLAGLVTAKIGIKGKEPSIGGSLRIDNASYSGYAFTLADGDFTYKKGEFALSDAILKRDGSSLRLLSGHVNDKKEFSFRASSDNLRLREAIPYGNLPVDYRIALTASGKGSFDNPLIETEGELSGGAFKGLPVQGGEFKAKLAGRRLDADLSLYAGRLTLKGSATLGGEFPWKAGLNIKGGRYDQFIAGYLKDVPEDLFISVQGGGEFSGTKASISGQLRLRQLSVAAYGQSFSLDREAIIAIKDRAVKIGALSMRAGQASLSIEGEAVVGESMDFNAVGRTSLAPLKAFVKEITHASGEADFVVHAGGAWEKPRISGGLRASEAVLGFKGLPQSIKVTKAYIYVDESRLVVEEFAGLMGGGEIGATGVAYLEGLRPRRFYFDALVNNVNMTFRDISAAFNGNLAFKGDQKGSSLAGELFVWKASYKKPIDWKEVVFKRKKPSPPRLGLLAGTRLNVRVYGSENILIDNNIARAPLVLDVTLRGTLANPVPVGRAEASRGKVYFRNTEFTIEYASVIFTDPERISPSLNILATSVVQGYKIRVNITGTPDRFNLALSSDPTLDEMKILSLLTLGDFGEGIKGVEGGIGAAEATSFITGQFQNAVSERLRDITGFDRLEIDPYISKKTGAVSPRVTVSKRLLGEKLYVTYAAPIGIEEEQIIKLEYAVTSTTSLIGLRDERGSVGGDVKFRFEFK
jgi:translocation and assembly module TamB